MRNAILLPIMIIIATSLILYSLLMKLWPIAILTFCLTLLFRFYVKNTKHDIQHELYAISNILEEILLKRESIQSLDFEDTITSKISHQIFQIHKINQGIQQKVSADHDLVKRQIAEIAHQLRTPLSNLNVYCSLLSDPELPPLQREEYLGVIRQTSDSIHFLIEKFILSSRLETEIIQIKKQEESINQIIAAAINQVWKIAEEKGIRISVRNQNEQGVLADIHWLSEALANILENSIKYSALHSEINIHVTSNEMYTSITVDDEGIGIEEGKENLIFQRYYRGDNVTNQPGYGLGLYITREILQKHNGFLRVRRREKGTSLAIFLPNVN